MVSIDSPRPRATAWTVIGACGAVAAIPVVMLLPFRDVGWIADDFFFRHVTFRNALAAWISGWGHNLAVGVPGYRPVPMATYALDHWIWAGAPSGYHITNLL